jgi:hypothetical protein
VTKGYSAEIERLRSIAQDEKTDPSDKLKTAILALYETIISSPVGRMSPLIAEVSRAFPSVARSFHDDYIQPQHEIFSRIIDEGVDKGDFVDIDRQAFLHLTFGPIVTLSLSREMFATFDDLDNHFPMESLKVRHVDVMMSLIKPR